MSNPALQIIQPAHGAGFPAGSPIALRAALTGASTGLYFKWYSSLNSAATANHPELNATDHSAAILDWSHALPEFGSHVLVVAAVDDDSNPGAVTRSAMAGGAPPDAPLPCVVHRLLAQIRTPAADGQVLAKSACTIEFLAPARWAKESPPASGTWIADGDYQRINGIAIRLRLAPAGPADAAHTAELPLDLATLPFFRADDKTWFRRTGALPANLGVGNYSLTLLVGAGAATASATRQVVLAA